MPAPELQPTVFRDTAAANARALETPAANFENGMNLSGSCACGIGINMLKGAVVGTPEQFTLLDQGNLAAGDAPAPRVPQISQSIGGFPYVDRATVDWPSSGGTPDRLPKGSIRFGTLPTNA
ncbi:MAG: hypothetical protein DRQ98_12140, partial [Gammaproteobacteria bacterium]